MDLKKLESFIFTSTNAKEIFSYNKIQTLWGGYGEIIRLKVKKEKIFTIIIKNVVFPDIDNTSFSHKRKVRSYEVEINWYKYWSKYCNDDCKIANCIGIKNDINTFAIILEDLDSLGYLLRKERLNKKEALLCLKWLANFHACFMNIKATHLWEIGTYWHLATRPDEFRKMKNSFLKENAEKIDTQLNNAKYKTFVHGDAKTANFCFSKDLDKVAVVDFQYVGNGCGMKDIAYFFDSAFSEKQLFEWEEELLNYYFEELNYACNKLGKELNFIELEKEWRFLYPLCRADFHRFLEGWLI